MSTSRAVEPRAVGAKRAIASFTSDLAKAVEHMKSGRHFGKIAIAVSP